MTPASGHTAGPAVIHPHLGLQPPCASPGAWGGRSRVGACVPVAARGELDEARPLVERLETMAPELILGLEGLSLETLRRRGTTPSP